MRPGYPGAFSTGNCAIMKLVIHMKKRLIFLAALLIPLVVCLGFFLYRGGHHAVRVYIALENWLEANSSDQSLHAELNGFSLDSDLYWIEKSDERLWAIENDRFGVYLHEGILYSDAGNAYSVELPEEYEISMPRFLAAMLLAGHIDQDGDLYRLSLETDDLMLSADLSVTEGLNGTLRSCSMELETTGVHLSAVLEKKPYQKRRLPQNVLDAMVQAEMEPPVSVMEPYSLLLPVLRDMEHHSYDTTLSIECGILELTQSGTLQMAGSLATLEYEGYSMTVQLPGQMVNIDPTGAALAVLYRAQYSTEDGISRFHMTIPADLTAELAEKLVPQAADLGIVFDQCEAQMVITDGKLTSVTIGAAGTVPFLLSTIPIAFSAEFLVN